MASEPADVIYVNIEVHLGWRDRLRTLAGRAIDVRAEVGCEHLPGRTFNRITASVRPLWRRKPKHLGRPGGGRRSAR